MGTSRNAGICFNSAISSFASETFSETLTCDLANALKSVRSSSSSSESVAARTDADLVASAMAELEALASGAVIGNVPGLLATYADWAEVEQDLLFARYLREPWVDHANSVWRAAGRWKSRQIALALECRVIQIDLLTHDDISWRSATPIVRK